MKFATASSPHTPSTGELNALMRQVIYALLPAIATAWWFFGWGVLINIAIASIFALGAEAAILLLRNRPLAPALSDCSALLTAILLGLALPALAPWWLAAVGALFAIVFAKQLYGGLGFNPFNPAMVGYVVLLISFPLEMTSWPAPQELATVSLSLVETLSYSFGGTLPAALGLDALTTATPLDTIKTGVGLEQSVAAISQSPLFGQFGGKGWEWLAAAYLLGGAWLLYKRIISWHIPAGLLGALALIATLFWLGDASRYASPLFHLFSGAAIIGAFFIATDPISAATTLRGRLLFGIGIGLITYIIRTWGGYPDGTAFAVLLMNMAAPTLDYYTRPRVFGQGGAEMLFRHIIGTMLLLALFAMVGTGLVALTHAGTQERIATNAREALLKSIHALIPPSSHDNDIFTDTVAVSDPLLGNDEPHTAYRARSGTQAVAVVLTPIAPDGYSGTIKLLVAIKHDSTLAGVRILSHRETPGLGDGIEVERSDWVLGFNSRSLSDPTIKQWGVKKDGGSFDQFTGATITPRAVVKAVKQSLLYFRDHRDTLFALPQQETTDNG